MVTTQVKLDQPVTMLKVSFWLICSQLFPVHSLESMTFQSDTLRLFPLMVLVELPRTSDGLEPPPADLYPTLNILF